jgi:hypothetical protein
MSSTQGGGLWIPRLYVPERRTSVALPIRLKTQADSPPSETGNAPLLDYLGSQVGETGPSTQPQTLIQSDESALEDTQLWSLGRSQSRLNLSSTPDSSDERSLEEMSISERLELLRENTEFEEWDFVVIDHGDGCEITGWTWLPVIPQPPIGTGWTKNTTGNQTKRSPSSTYASVARRGLILANEEDPETSSKAKHLDK